jgi:hypothetical protein
MPSLVIWVATSENTATGISLTADEALNATFINAIIYEIQHTSTDTSNLYIKKLLIPLISLGAKRFDYETTTGVIGSKADPLLWQDGFIATEVSFPSKKLFVLGSSGDKVSVLSLDDESSADMKATNKREVSWGSLDLSSLQ